MEWTKGFERRPLDLNLPQIKLGINGTYKVFPVHRWAVDPDLERSGRAVVRVTRPGQLDEDWTGVVLAPRFLSGRGAKFVELDRGEWEIIIRPW